MNLPNFLIIGAAKAATTSLYHYLEAHPEVFMSAVKEVNFFAYSSEGLGFPPDWNKERHHQFPAKTLEQYAALFQTAGEYKAVGEASPLYLDSPLAPDRIRRILPDVRLIVSLRNPVERLISDYRMRARCGFTQESFEEEFQPGKQIYELGFIAPRLGAYIDGFGRNRIKVLLFDEIAAKPVEAMKDLYAFLEVSCDFVPDVEKRYNTAPVREPGTSRSRVRKFLGKLKRAGSGGLGSLVSEFRTAADRRPPPPSLDAYRQRISDTYREDILRLQDMIGRDLSSWLENESASLEPERE